MRVLLFILFSLFPVATFCQPVTKVLVIDTIMGDVSNFRVAVVKPVDSDNLDYFEKSMKPEIILANFPNLIMPVYGKFAHSRLQIPLDDSGGYLELENAFLLQCDTIRISKLNIFHNCLPDTTEYFKGWYRKKFSDTAIDLIQLGSKTKIWKIINKDCRVTYPATVSFIITNKIFNTNIEISRHSGYTSWYHGFGRIGARRNQRRKEFGKSYKYFAACVRENKHVLIANIKLQ